MLLARGEKEQLVSQVKTMQQNCQSTASGVSACRNETSWGGKCGHEK